MQFPKHSPHQLPSHAPALVGRQHLKKRNKGAQDLITDCGDKRHDLTSLMIQRQHDLITTLKQLQVGCPGRGIGPTGKEPGQHIRGNTVSGIRVGDHGLSAKKKGRAHPACPETRAISPHYECSRAPQIEPRHPTCLCQPTPAKHSCGTREGRLMAASSRI